MVLQTPAPCEPFEVLLLDVYFGSDLRPMPTGWKLHAGQKPSLQLLPSILGQEYGRTGQLPFDAVESTPSANLPIAINAENE